MADAETGAETAVGAGVEPAAGTLRLDVLAREGDEVAAVADDDRVLGQPRDQLAVDPGGVDRVGLGAEQRGVAFDAGLHLVLQVAHPRGPVGASYQVGERVPQPVEDQGEVARRLGREVGVLGDLSG